MKEDFRQKEKEAVKNYCVNPVDSRIAAVEKPENLEMEQTEPEDVASIEGFTDMTEPELEAYRKEMGFAMSAEDIKFVQEYYRDTEKTPADSNGDKSNRYLLV